jgi:hypothetical protein
MITFGLAMLIGNLAFVSPQLVRHVVAWLTRSPTLPVTELSPETSGGRRARRAKSAITSANR